MSVSPGINVSAYEGRQIVIAGRFAYWPGSLAFMRGASIAPIPRSSNPRSSTSVRVSSANASPWRVLETRADSGQVVRSFSFPWDDKLERAYMRGRTYSTVKAQPKKP